MTSILQPVRGTHDLWGEEARRFNKIISVFRTIAQTYGCLEITTPIFEFSEVFHRTLGETSDVVTKETYDFTDRGGASLTLRPEITAGIARAFISSKMAGNVPLKFFSFGPLFRYERPQKGRTRQFHQVDIEFLGVPEPQADIEVLALGYDFLRALGLIDQVTLKLNTLGDKESRTAYRAALVAYFSSHFDALSEESRQRLKRNPLRIFDSKDAGDRLLIADAPLLSDYLTDTAQAFFTKVTEGLQALEIPFHYDQHLVRGLDYYDHTAWEFTTDALGSQGSLLAGGRYDGLIATMGGPPTAGIGWAAGIERLSLMIAPPERPPPPIVIVPIGAIAEHSAFVLARRLRLAGFTVEQGYRGSVGKRLEKAAKLGARVALLIGETELSADVVKCRNLTTAAEHLLPLADIETSLAGFK